MRIPEKSKMVANSSISFFNGRYSLSNHIKARTRYINEYINNPKELDLKSAHLVQVALENKGVSKKYINLYLFRFILKYYVSKFLYEWLNGNLNTSNIFTKSNLDPLSQYSSIDKLLDQNHSIHSAKSLILSMINYELDSILLDLSNGTITDTKLTTNQNDRAMPILSQKEEKQLRTKYSS